jgi:hypothetical protein
MLPVVLEFSPKEDIPANEPLRLTFPQASGEMEYMRLDEKAGKGDWKQGWGRFFDELQDEDGKPVETDRKGPPERGFYRYYPVQKVKDNALRIAAFDSPTALVPGGGKQPFLVQGPWGSGTVFYISSGETWRLRMFRDSYHERFWTKLLREVGSKSLNTSNKRITPVMARQGTVNKFVTFEARFEDLNGEPLRRDIKSPPKLIVTLPEAKTGDEGPQKGDLVLIKDGEYTGKKGKVAEVNSKLDQATGAETRTLKLVTIEGADPKVTVALDATKVELLSPPIDFKPRLGSKKNDPNLDKENAGWFKVEFQPRRAGDYKLKVVYEDSADNFYATKFHVEESNPELDNVRPDPEALWELASSAKLVLARVSDAPTKQKIRALLARHSESVKPAKPGEKVERDATDEGMRLYFELKDREGVSLIPECMLTEKRDLRTKGKVKDLWDEGWVSSKTDSGEDRPVLPYALLAIVGLFGVEWLMRKMLRLA